MWLWDRYHATITRIDDAESAENQSLQSYRHHCSGNRWHQHHNAGACGEDGGMAHDVVETDESSGNSTGSDRNQQKHVWSSEFQAEQKGRPDGHRDQAGPCEHQQARDRQINSTHSKEAGDGAYASGNRVGIGFVHSRIVA